METIESIETVLSIFPFQYQRIVSGSDTCFQWSINYESSCRLTYYVYDKQYSLEVSTDCPFWIQNNSWVEIYKYENLNIIVYSSKDLPCLLQGILKK